MLKLLVKKFPSKLSRLVSWGNANYSNAPKAEAASANSAEGRLKLYWTEEPATEKFPEELLAEKFQEKGWRVRSHVGQPDFQAGSLHLKKVAFSLRDENDQLVEYSGTLDAFSTKAATLFKLQEREDEVFNLNLCGFVAAEV